jgi:4-hydroxybenzoate polyprenyltransferase
MAETVRWRPAVRGGLPPPFGTTLTFDRSRRGDVEGKVGGRDAESMLSNSTSRTTSGSLRPQSVDRDSDGVFNLGVSLLFGAEASIDDMSFWRANLVSARGDGPNADLGERGTSKLLERPPKTIKAIRSRRVIDFVIRNRIHLLPAAALIAWAAPPLYGSTPSWNAVPSILLAGFGIYQLNRVFDVVEDRINDPQAYVYTTAARRLILKVAAGAIASSVFLSILLTNYFATIVLSIMILGGILYSAPFLNGKQKEIRLKQIPSLKNVVPSLVWPITTIVYPAMSTPEVHWLQLLLLVTGVSCSVFTIEVAWDVRDSSGDQIAGIRTLATAFGSHRALLVPLLLSSGDAVIIVFLVYMGILTKLWLLPALLLVLLPTVAYLWKDSFASNRDRSHLLILMNILALILLGLAGRWGG